MATTDEIIEPLRTRVWAHAALTAALETGVATDPSKAKTEVEEALVGVLDALGVTPEGLEEDLAPPFGEALRGELHSDLLQSTALARAAKRGELTGGWDAVDADTVDAQSETGRVFRFAAQMLFPNLDGLDERLQATGARFLDVGAGAGVLSIELCNLYPEVTAVGLEPLDTARRVAAEKLSAAGLGDRIEVRDQLVEELDDRDAFDLAYVPAVFLGDGVHDGLARVRDAVRPGGWVLLLTLADAPDDLSAAIRRLRIALWGGTPLSTDDGQRLLTELGLEQVTVPPSVGAYQPVLGRLPASS